VEPVDRVDPGRAKNGRAHTENAEVLCDFARETHELREAIFQDTLAATSNAEPGGKEPVAAGVLARTLLLQTSGNVGAWDAVERTIRIERSIIIFSLGHLLVSSERPKSTHMSTKRS
jgi:hypothetical protein